LPDPNGGFQRKPTLASTTLNVLSWSRAAGTGRSAPRDRDPIAERLLRVEICHRPAAACVRFAKQWPATRPAALHHHGSHDALRAVARSRRMLMCRNLSILQIYQHHTSRFQNRLNNFPKIGKIQIIIIVNVYIVLLILR
jgi:hypothetical protein